MPDPRTMRHRCRRSRIRQARCQPRPDRRRAPSRLVPVRRRRSAAGRRPDRSSRTGSPRQPGPRQRPRLGRARAAGSSAATSRFPIAGRCRAWGLPRVRDPARGGCRRGPRRRCGRRPRGRGRRGGEARRRRGGRARRRVRRRRWGGARRGRGGRRRARCRGRRRARCRGRRRARCRGRRRARCRGRRRARCRGWRRCADDDPRPVDRDSVATDVGRAELRGPGSDRQARRHRELDARFPVRAGGRRVHRMRRPADSQR